MTKTSIHKILCKLFGHKYKDVAFNRYGLCNYRECKRCGKAFDRHDIPNRLFEYVWKECEKIEFYDDGTKITRGN